MKNALIDLSWMANHGVDAGKHDSPRQVGGRSVTTTTKKTPEPSHSDPNGDGDHKMVTRFGRDPQPPLSQFDSGVASNQSQQNRFTAEQKRTRTMQQILAKNQKRQLGRNRRS